MRLSELFFTSLRDDPSEAEMPSHRLLLRAGYLRQLGAGIYSLLPLGFRVTKRVEQVIREEMDRIGCQEIEMPVVHPADLWRESGRYQKIGPELVRFKDRGERDMVLAMTHEEVIADLLRDIVRSYRQLPVMLYHFQTKFRDEPRSRGGLIRVREFVMKDAYSCDRDEAGLDASYQAQYGAYVRIFERLGLDAVVVGADVGIMGGSKAHEFMVLNEFGEDTLVLCDGCGYAENQQIAVVGKPSPDEEEALPMEEIATPGTTTIATLARFLGVGEERTAKAAFFVTGDDRFVVAIVRGDYDVNETKLVNAIKATGGLRPATVEEIKARGMEPGYGSPVGARDAVVVVDELVERSPNLVAGANREGYHLRNTNVGRDYTPDLVAEITNAREGDPCPTCGLPVKLSKGIEVGNIFKLGTDFTIPFGATYLGEDGVAHPIVMGSYGIGLGRNVACIVEAHHDEKGIVWPASVAPYQAHLVAIGSDRDPRVTEIAERLHEAAFNAAADAHRPELEILYDDRSESPGVKFTDAELLGMPRILTVSPRSLAAGGIEVTDRATGARSTMSIDEVEASLIAG
jgi:prolyl-tRNA synthetase